MPGPSGSVKRQGRDPKSLGKCQSAMGKGASGLSQAQEAVARHPSTCLGVPICFQASSGTSMVEAAAGGWLPTHGEQLSPGGDEQSLYWTGFSVEEHTLGAHCFSRGKSG